MSVRKGLVAVSVVAVMYPWAVSAAQRQEHQPTPGQSPASAESLRCAQAQPVITRVIEAAMARLETARQANSPAQMRAAIDDLQGALRDVRVQLAPCAAMHTAMPGHTVPNPPAATASSGNAPAADPHAGHTTATAPAKEVKKAEGKVVKKPKP